MGFFCFEGGFRSIPIELERFVQMWSPMEAFVAPVAGEELESF